MTDNTQQEALRLAASIDKAACIDYYVEFQTALRDSAAELRRLHTENEALASKLKTYEDLGDAGSDVQLLRMGYAAARLEIESLQARIKTMAEEHADELMVAHLDGRMRASHGQAPAGWQDTIADVRNALADSTPSAFDNSGYREFASTVLDEVEERLTTLAAVAAGAQVESDLIGWEQAHKIAFQAAAAFHPPYFTGPGFVAHTWVVEAIRSAHIDGQRHARGLPPIDRVGATAASPTAQAAPAAVAGLSEAVSIQRQAFIRGWDERGMAHQLKGTVETDERMRVLMDIYFPRTAAPAQPAPQQEAQEPVAWYVTGGSRLLDEDEAKAEARHIGGTARATPLYTVPQQYEALILQLVEALEGYRRNHNDTQPCDAERAGRAWLEGKP